MNWISVNERLPETGKKVIATFVNRSGKRRTICAHRITGTGERGMKELLERAAKNAGYDFYWSGLQQCVFIRDGGGSAVQWTPAESDADAFRLMVDCEMEIDFGDKSVVIRRNGLKFIVLHANHNNDKLAATRVAILKAAAGSE